MSITYGFYNAFNHDRKYNSVQISKIFDGVIEDGIFMTIGDKFITTAGTGMTVIVGSGKAWFNHTWTENDSDLPVNMYPSEVVLNRIDALVLEVDSTDPVRANTIKFIKGTPASTPVLPSITATTGIYRHIICSVYIAAGATSITNANITNYVGTATTPFVSGVLETVSIDALLGQWQSDLDNFVSSETVAFDTWFDQMKDQLSVDAAGNLQLQINTLDSRLDSIGNELVSFTTESSRVIPSSGESISIIFGKIRKWLTDLKDGAFSTVSNLLTVTAAGYVLDARQGKVLNDSLGKWTQIYINNNVNSNQTYTTANYTGAKALAFKFTINEVNPIWLILPNVVDVDGSTNCFNSETEYYKAPVAVGSTSTTIKTFSFIKSSAWAPYTIGLTVYKIM